MKELYELRLSIEQMLALEDKVNHLIEINGVCDAVLRVRLLHALAGIKCIETYNELMKRYGFDYQVID